MAQKVAPRALSSRVCSIRFAGCHAYVGGAGRCVTTRGERGVRQTRRPEPCPTPARGKKTVFPPLFIATEK